MTSGDSSASYQDTDGETRPGIQGKGGRVGAKRQLGNTGGIRVSCQGYHDGACWEMELSKTEIETDTLALLREWCIGGDAERARVAAHAWKARVPAGHLREVLVRAV